MPEPPTIFVLGDSISIEYGPHLARALAGTFRVTRKGGDDEARRNLDLPAGANGGDSGMCRQYLADRLREGGIPADVLLLNCGLHDIKTDATRKPLQVSRDAYRENLAAILDLAAELRLAPVWVRTTPVDEAQHNTPGNGIWRYTADLDAYNATADDVMAERNVPTIDLHAFTLNLGPVSETLRDGRHFREPVPAQQAAYLAGWLTAWRRHGGLSV